jgi:hypothetical protein
MPLIKVKCSGEADLPKNPPLQEIEDKRGEFRCPPRLLIFLKDSVLRGFPWPHAT